MIRIAVDAMGGDIGPDVTLAASLAFLQSHSSAAVVIVGQPKAMAMNGAFSLLQAHARCDIVEATEVVTMDDPVETALRRKKDSSMRVAINQVKSGHAQAAVSGGNTGALMAIARYVLKTLDGIDRPAIASQLPNAAGKVTTMLDLGANVDCTQEHLLQFAVMGSALVTAISGIESPSVGLLNIGEEAIKGSDMIKKAGHLMRYASACGDINFYGNVEGDDIFKGTTDLVVCDGFVGNVALKTSEGLAHMIGDYIKAEFSRTLMTKLAALVAYPVLSAFKRRFDHRCYNGAALLGLRGLVFKSHGSADVFAFERALGRAYDAARNQLVERVQERIAHAAPLLANSVLTLPSLPPAALAVNGLNPVVLNSAH